MKHLAALLLVGALVALMLQPVTLAVNTLSGKNVLRADGGGPPPPFPPPPGGGLIADGGGPPPPFPPPPDRVVSA
jgi:hypothetical protein